MNNIKGQLLSRDVLVAVCPKKFLFIVSVLVNLLPCCGFLFFITPCTLISHVCPNMVLFVFHLHSY